MATARYLVNDVEQSLTFYKALGFELTGRMGAAFASLKRGDQTLWLSGPGTSAARPLENGLQPVSGGWNRLVVMVEDLQACLDALAPVGVVARSKPIVGPGGRHVVLDDPSGNPIEIFQAAQ